MTEFIGVVAAKIDFTNRLAMKVDPKLSLVRRKMKRQCLPLLRAKPQKALKWDGLLKAMK
jgi:hypothetical protein